MVYSKDRLSVEVVDSNDPVAAVSIMSDLDSVAPIWLELERQGASTPYQSFAWYEAWMRVVAPGRGETPLIIVAFDDKGEATLLLPLVLRCRCFAHVASFAGGKHANFNMPLVRPDVTFTKAALDRLFLELVRLRPDIDLFAFDALPASWNGADNPLVAASARPHTAPASVLSLMPDPRQLFDMTSTAGRKRKLRAIDRKFDQSGVTFRRAASKGEIGQALDAFSSHKVPWFLARGLPNPFEPCVLAFFADLAMHPRSPLQIHGLYSPDDAIVAVTATLVANGRASLMFVSYDASSPLAAHSPGTKLVREVILEACSRGLASFDFGLGEAAYKTSFGATLEPSYVVLRSQTLRGELVAWGIEGKRRLKMSLKAHPRLLGTLLRWSKALPSLGGSDHSRLSAHGSEMPIPAKSCSRSCPRELAAARAGAPRSRRPPSHASAQPGAPATSHR